MLDRRKFLQFGASLSVLPLVDLNAKPHTPIKPGLVLNGSVVSAAHWGALKLTLKGGKLIKSTPWEKTTAMDNPLQHFVPDLAYRSRVKHPYVRLSYLKDPKNPRSELRGKEPFVQVSYKHAITLVAEQLRQTRAEKGGVFGGSYGWKSSGNIHNARTLLHRFLNLTGGFIGSLGDYSTGASQVIMPYVVGSIEVYEQQTSWENILAHSKCVVVWGADPLSTLRIAWSASDQRGLAYLERLKKSKIKVICIDPVRTDTAKFLGAEWVGVRPNTDVALMLGMACHLVQTNKHDLDILPIAKARGFWDHQG
ncbi:hypothetical protein NHP21011_13860 [Helicobacter heilmannii]|nr:hypothetical protein NHP21011_13860 [Helicobacter heilmannii]